MLRLVVACPGCERQYDATGHPAGTHFRCRCGCLVTVEPVREQLAAVVRCSACGAARQGSGFACAHCGADFTLHERDLDTVCPGCLTRISGRARFCHGCGVPITFGERAGESTEQSCPACGEATKLYCRRIADRLSVDECGRCVGLWIDNATFEHVVDRAEQLSSTIHGPGAGVPATGGAPPPAPGGPAYRPCVRCGKLMNRHNYGKRSNVIIDVCREHGAWFDAHELERILAWVRGGGLESMRALEREQLRDERRRQEAAARPTAFGDASTPNDDGGPDLFAELLRWLG